MNHHIDVPERQQGLLVFHLTGKRAEAGMAPIEDLRLRPALFARVTDLANLRYDYPLVLAEPEDAQSDHGWLRTLSGIVDEVLKKIAPDGIAGERMRKNILRLERQIRALMQEGAGGTLLELWDEAASLLIARGGESVEDDLARARAALGTDGPLLDCDAATPARLMAHAWRSTEGRKALGMRRRIDELIQRLSDLIKADYLRSEGGRHAEALKAGIGGAHRALFDFQQMASLLAKPSGASALSKPRRERMESALETLRAQKFFATDGGGHDFIFDETRDAIAAYRRRLPEMAALVKAMTIAELEVHGRYVERTHDALFEGWNVDSLGPEERARFPSYLVCRTAGSERKDGGGAAARALLLKVLASNAPVKIVVESGSLLEESRAGGSTFSFGAQLAASAMGLSQAYVIQSAASHLYQVREKLVGAMCYPGAALISVYTGARSPSDEGRGPPTYLLSAAAMESRAFPAFCYDPGAGADWAARFSLEGNPQPDADWPLHAFSWADGKLQRVEEALPFTLADFALCDPDYARHFARVPREAWNDALIDVGQWLAQPASGVPEKLPTVGAIDNENGLHKLIVDEKLLRAARVCREAWHRLQELDRLKRKDVPPAKEPVKEEAKPQEAPKPAPQAEPAQEKREPGDPYIETERCSSCNECTNLNNVMFAYNENKQAYIANPDGGSFKELVEAAESCQVAVIHPGKPRNPKEPGLEELVKRAEPFQ